MATTPTIPARDPLAGDPAEAAIRGMVETIVRGAQPLAGLDKTAVYTRL